MEKVRPKVRLNLGLTGDLQSIRDRCDKLLRPRPDDRSICFEQHGRIGMTKQILHLLEIHAGCYEIRGKGVPQQVWCAVKVDRSLRIRVSVIRLLWRLDLQGIISHACLDDSP